MENLISHFSTSKQKLKALTKSFDTDVWVIVTLKQPLARGSHTQIKFSKLKIKTIENKVVTGKTVFHSICLNTSFWQFCLQMLRFQFEYRRLKMVRQFF